MCAGPRGSSLPWPNESTDYADRVSTPSGPAWRDPLLAPRPPTGTGSGAYVEQPEPRANPMTIEGEIAGIGEMARGVTRASGWRGQLGRAVVVIALLAFGAGIVDSLVNLFRG